MEHSLVMAAHERWGITWELRCPFDVADESRPCWPHYENGEPFTAKEAAPIGCNWGEWFGEMDVEMVTEMPETSWPVTAHWDGDHFTMTLGAPTSAIVHEEAPDER